MQKLLPGTLALAVVLGACGGGGGGGGEKTNASFQLAAAPDLVVGHQGADAFVQVTVTRAAGFADDVVVTLSSAGPGIDAGGSLLVSGSMTSGWLQMSIAPGADVGGPVTLTVTGTGGGATATKNVSLTVVAAEPSSQAKIASAQAAGALDAGTALLYRAYAAFGDPRLPADYVGSGPSLEDSGLVIDIRAALPGLTPDLQALLLPFTLRPSDPGSWYALGVVATTTKALAAGADGIGTVRRAQTGAAPPPQSCAEITSGFEWASRRSASYPVRAWVPCSGDPVYDGQSMQMLGETLAVLDKAWQPLGELMGDAAGNPILDLDGADEAIDVYVDRGSGVDRAGNANSAGTLGGIAIKDAPGVGKTHSAFILIPELQFGTPRFHPTIIHELFHVFQFAYNGDIADAAAPPGAVAKYWFYEASATWAGASFDRVLAPWSEPRGAYLVAYGRFKARFQPSHTSLNGATEENHDYSAFIWPYFLEQSTGGPGVVGQIWKNLAGATTSVEADDVIDVASPFTAHFREFALRNLNASLLPGDPLPAAKRYIALDPDFKDDGVEPPYAATLDIASGAVNEEFTVDLAPLTARYLKFPVSSKDVKQVNFDLSDLTRWTGLDVDALVKIDGTWEATPRDLNGKPKLQFCVDKPGEAVEEVRFILSNHDRKLLQDVHTVVGVAASTVGCKGGWTGTSYTASFETTQPGVRCSSDDVTWVFDPVESDALHEHYVAHGTVKYSRAFTDGSQITYDYNPSTYAIDPAEQISEAGLNIRPDPSGVGFIVTGGASTVIPTIETTTLYGDPATATPRQTFVECQWFGAGPSGSKLAADGTTISDTADTLGDVHGYSFSKN